MLSTTFKFSVLTAASVLAASLPFQTARATNGQLPACIGTYKCGMGGAGLTIASDPTAAAVNPALAARMGSAAIVSFGGFKADVERELAGALANTAGGKQKSKADLFYNGSLGVNYLFDDGKALNLSIYPGGGGATAWENSRTNSGATDSTDMDMDWKMFNLQLAAAYSPTPQTSLGAGIVLSYATMETDSLDNGFGRDIGIDSRKHSQGVGFQVGLVHDINDKVSLALDGHSKVWHQRFKDLKNIFNSTIDRPATAAIGVDYK